MGWISKDFSLSGLKVLVLGGYGVGKSYFAKTFPEPIFLLDFDGGAIGYSGTKTYVPDYFTSRPQPSQLFALVERDLDQLISESHPEGQFKTVVLDSLTTLSKFAMDLALQKRPVSPDSPPVWNIHYPMVKVFLDRILDKLRQFKGIVVAIGHVEYQKDDVTGEILALPALTGKLQGYIPAVFDEVYFADITQSKDGPQYVIHLSPKGFKRARSRLRSVFPEIPETIPNDFGEIQKYLPTEGHVKPFDMTSSTKDQS